MPEINFGRLPFKDAIGFLRDKKAVPTEAYTDLLHEQHDNAFVVAGLTKVDILADIQKSLVDAMQNGTPFEQWQKKDFNRIIEGHWIPVDKRTGEVNSGWRARLIYETNMRTAYAAGEHQQLQRVKKTHPFWRYRHGDSRVPRQEHLAWDGMVLRADDPWWETHYPPNGWGCRCYVEPISRAEMEDLGKVGEDGRPKPDTPPPVQMRTVKYGDRMVEVPKGVDPGWAYVPGKSLEPVKPLPAAPNASPDKILLIERQREKVPPKVFEKFVEELEAGAPKETTQEAPAKQEVDAKQAEKADSKEKAGSEKVRKLKEDAEKAIEEAKPLEKEARDAEEKRNKAQKELNLLENEARKLNQKYKASADTGDLEKATKKEREASDKAFELLELSDEADKKRGAADEAWDKARQPFVESAWAEALEATGQEFPNPIEFEKLKKGVAQYHNGKITIDTKFVRDLVKNETVKSRDGVGFFVDRKTLEIVYVPSAERLKQTLVHELAHVKHPNHEPDFHKLVYDYLCKALPNYSDYLLVWDPTPDDDHPYTKWEDRPDQIDRATWEKMKQEQEERNRKEQEERQGKDGQHENG